MKRLVIFIIVVALSLLPSCDGKRKEPESDSDGITSDNGYQIIIDEKDNVFEFVSRNIFFSDDLAQNGYSYEQDLENWVSTIKTKFGIELEIHSLFDDESAGLLPSSTYNYTEKQYEYLKNIIETNQISGLLRILNPELLPRLIEDGLIIPISPYLANNGNWDDLPADIKRIFSFSGETWGIPTSSSTKCFSRYYREDWLENLEMDVPYTIDDFYDVLKAFTYDDPDGDGLDNTRGADRFFHPIGLQDIFTAFDARPNPEGDFLPTLNPNSGVWEDSILKPEYKEAMEFLIACEEEGILARSEYKDNLLDFQRGISGSFGDYRGFEHAASTIARYVSGDSKPGIVYTPGLIHNIDKNLCGVFTTYGSPYVLLSSTVHPYSTLNTLVNIFISDEEGYLLGKYGPADYYTRSDEIVAYKTYQYNSKHYPYDGPNIMYYSPFYNDIAIPDYMIDKNTDEYMTHNSMDRFASLEKNDLCYEIPFDALYPDYGIEEARIRFLNNMSRNMISWVLDSGMDLDSVIEQYRSEAKKMDMQDFLDEQNKKLGKLSQQHY